MKKLTKRIPLLEDFSASDISKPNQSVSPEGKTTIGSIAINKTAPKTKDVDVASGEEVRADIIKDVDSILSNLETLSNQITEDAISEFELATLHLFEDESAEEAIVPIHEDFMEMIMKGVASAKSYATLRTSYPKYKKNILKAEITKKQKLGEFEFKLSDTKEGMAQKVKDAFQKKIDGVNASDMPAIKKKAQRDAIRAQRDKAIADQAGSVAVKVKAKKDKLTKQLDNAIRDLNTKLTDLTTGNKIEAELTAKQWEREKLAIDDAHAEKQIDAFMEVDLEFTADNPEMQAKIAKKEKETRKKMNDESATKRKQLEQDLKDAQAELTAEAEKGTEDEKAAKAKINAFLTAGNEYINFLSTLDFDKIDDDKELKAQLKEKKKAYTDANGDVSVTDFEKASEGTSKEDAEDQFTSFTKSVGDAVEEYKASVDGVSTSDDDEETLAKSVKEVAEKSIGDGFNDYKGPLTKEQSDEQVEVPPAEEGGDPTSKAKYKDIKGPFKAKDEEGNDTGDDTYYAKLDDSQSAATVDGEDLSEAKVELPNKVKLYEGMTVADRFKALM